MKLPSSLQVHVNGTGLPLLRADALPHGLLQAGHTVQVYGHVERVQAFLIDFVVEVIADRNHGVTYL